MINEISLIKNIDSLNLMEPTRSKHSLMSLSYDILYRTCVIYHNPMFYVYNCYYV
jgi:hypothetical protein